MSDYDRFANARYGAGVARSATGAIDQGLRAYMLGVYNYMTLGLGVTGVVAYARLQALPSSKSRGRIVGLTAFGAAIYTSPLRWVVIFAAARRGVHVLRRRATRCRVSGSARRVPAVRGADRPLDVDDLRRVHARLDRPRVLRDGGRVRRAEPLWLHDEARPVADRLVPDDGTVRPHHRQHRQHVPAELGPAVGAVDPRASASSPA